MVSESRVHTLVSGLTSSNARVTNIGIRVYELQVLELKHWFQGGSMGSKSWGTNIGLRIYVFQDWGAIPGLMV